MEKSFHSWGNHSEEDIENLLVEGHAVITTMRVAQDMQFYLGGVYGVHGTDSASMCDKWPLPSNRDDLLQRSKSTQDPWEPVTSGLRPLTHAVTIVGFGEERGRRYWKIKGSWGSLWGESGFMRMERGGAAEGLCGIGAYIAVPLCGCYKGQSLPQANLSPPENLPEQEIIFGTAPNLTTSVARVSLVGVSSLTTNPLAALGRLTCGSRCSARRECPANKPCKLFCGAACKGRGGVWGTQCCRALAHGQVIYCPINPRRRPTSKGSICPVQ